MSKGLIIGISATVLISGFFVGRIFYKIHKESIKLISYNPSTKTAQLKVGGKNITFKIEKGLNMQTGILNGYSLSPEYSNLQDESTLYRISLLNEYGAAVNSVDLPR